MDILLIGLHYLEIGTILNIYVQISICILLAFITALKNCNFLSILNFLINSVIGLIIFERYTQYSLYKAAQVNVEDVAILADMWHISTNACNIIIFIYTFLLSICISLILRYVPKVWKNSKIIYNFHK